MCTCCVETGAPGGSHSFSCVCLLVPLGIFFVLPCIESYTKVDLRTVSFDVPPQEVRSRSFGGHMTDRLACHVFFLWRLCNLLSSGPWRCVCVLCRHGSVCLLVHMTGKMAALKASSQLKFFCFFCLFCFLGVFSNDGSCLKIDFVRQYCRWALVFQFACGNVLRRGQSSSSLGWQGKLPETSLL